MPSGPDVEMSRINILWPILAIALLLTSSSITYAESGEESSPVFVDVTQGSGLESIDSGPLTTWASYGPGIAWGDYDGDGDMDIFVSARFDHLGQETAVALGYEQVSAVPTGTSDSVAIEENATGTSHLIRNDGNGIFTDVSLGSGISTTNSTTLGATWADYDGDGDVDLYLSNYGRADFANPQYSGETNQMYRNDNGTFTDVTIETNLGNPGHSSGSVWVDYDHDGDLDCYSLNFGMIDEKNLVAIQETNILYRNDGDSDGDGIPEFSDQTREAGGLSGQKEMAGSDFETLVGPAMPIALTAPSNPSSQVQLPAEWGEHPSGSGMSWAAVWFDANGDGWEDLYVASDFGISPLYQNNGDGTFEIVTGQANLNKPGTGMGAHAADVDLDGDFEICQSNFGPNFLWNNQGDGTFSEDAQSLGLHTNTLVNWDCHFLDFDLDGDMDLWFGVGRINLYVSNQYNSLYRNDGDTDGDGRIEFTDVASEVGLSELGVDGLYQPGNKTMGAALADYDGDGDLDLLLGHADGGLRLWKNTAVESDSGQWLKVRLHGAGPDSDGSNRDGIGCLVHVYLEDGTILMQHAYAGDGFLGSGEPAVHFGLGDQDVSRVTVTWSTGHTQSITEVSVNSVLDVHEEVPEEQFDFSSILLVGIILSIGLLWYYRP